MEMMTKILFLIHDMGQGGAEKVLVNLVNNMDRTKYDITVMSLFDVGENRSFLDPDIKYKYWKKKMVRGNSHIMKLLSPQQLHRLIIKEHYDIEVAYLEGPVARVISGCNDPYTKKVVWIHREQKNTKIAASSFRSVKEAENCYNCFHRIIGVSESVINDFHKVLNTNIPTQILYNTNETALIRLQSVEALSDVQMFQEESINMIGVGKLLKNKGFDRVINIISRLLEDESNIHFYILGSGPEEENLKKQIKNLGLDQNVTLLGYQLNPYKYVSKADLFICASYAEGFSTAATEALILGVPVCTVNVSGMEEMLGKNNEYGIVTENTDEALYLGIKELLSDPQTLEHYRKQAKIRGEYFQTDKTVSAVQSMLEKL